VSVQFHRRILNVIWWWYRCWISVHTGDEWRASGVWYVVQLSISPVWHHQGIPSLTYSF